MTDAAPPSSPEVHTALRAFEWDQEPVPHAIEMLRLAQHRATLASLANSAPEEIARSLAAFGAEIALECGGFRCNVESARTALLALVAQREEQARTRTTIAPTPEQSAVAMRDCLLVLGLPESPELVAAVEATCELLWTGGPPVTVAMVDRQRAKALGLLRALLAPEEPSLSSDGGQGA